MTAINFCRSNRSIRAIIFALGCLIPFFCFGQDITKTDLSSNFFRMSSGIGFAEAYRAIADSPDAIIYNPAGLALKKGTMKLQADYAHIEDVDSSLYGASIADFQTSQTVAYGLAFHRFTPTIGGVNGNVNQTMLGLAYSLGSFAQIGISGKGYWVNLDSATLQGPRGVDLDLGAIIHPLKSVSLAVVGYNLARGGEVEEFPRQLALAAALNLEPSAIFSFDLVHNYNTPNLDKTNYNFGAQFQMAESVFLRGGFSFDEIAQNNFYSAGIAFLGPAADLLFTFSQRLSPMLETYAISAAFKF